MAHHLTINDWDALRTQDAQDYEKECVAASIGGVEFRRPGVSPKIQTVIENSSPEAIEEILLPVKRICPWLLREPWASVLLENEEFGSPETSLVEGANLRISSTTARYARHLSQILWLFGPLSGKRVAEIGGGYGGLANLIIKAFGPSSYTIYDLASAGLLQARYLRETGSTDVAEFTSIVEPREYDLVIGIASLCELRQEVVDIFAESIIGRAPNGYIVWSRPTEKTQSRQDTIDWLKSQGRAGRSGMENSLFRELCTNPLQPNTVYYWTQ